MERARLGGARALARKGDDPQSRGQGKVSGAYGTRRKAVRRIVSQTFLCRTLRGDFSSVPWRPPDLQEARLYFKFSGFKGRKSRGRNLPSLRMSSSSNQISPPPQSLR